MKIESKISEETGKGQKRSILIKYKDEWFSLWGLSKHPDLIEFKLNYDVLYARYNNPENKTIEDLVRKKSKKGRRIKKTRLTIADLGHHKDLKTGEIFTGFLSEKMFRSSTYWDTQRLGKGRILSGDNKGKRPYFILKSEISERGWRVV